MWCAPAWSSTLLSAPPTPCASTGGAAPTTRAVSAYAWAEWAPWRRKTFHPRLGHGRWVLMLPFPQPSPVRTTKNTGPAAQPTPLTATAMPASCECPLLRPAQPPTPQLPASACPHQPSSTPHRAFPEGSKSEGCFCPEGSTLFSTSMEICVSSECVGESGTGGQDGPHGCGWKGWGLPDGGVALWLWAGPDGLGAGLMGGRLSLGAEAQPSGPDSRSSGPEAGPGVPEPC